jgi:hypothetical protein
MFPRAVSLTQEDGTGVVLLVLACSFVLAHGQTTKSSGWVARVPQRLLLQHSAKAVRGR